MMASYNRRKLVIEYRRTGGHFFDPDTMRLWGSTLHESRRIGDGWLFITYERGQGFKLRHWPGRGTKVDTLFSSHYYSRVQQAFREKP